MSANYDGNSAGIVAHENPVRIVVPADSDPMNAALFNTPYQKLADYVKYLMVNAWLTAEATVAATAAKLALRDAAGRAQFADPSAAADAATKGYVDGGAVSITHGANWSSVSSACKTSPAGTTGQIYSVTQAGASWASIATLPAGSRPSIPRYFCGTVTEPPGSGGRMLPAIFSISTSGVVAMSKWIPNASDDYQGVPGLSADMYVCFTFSF